ncbi:cap-specific mRNA (nucleoside-2'-O-)-methyltransferase 2-like [Physella acuta]|uniref:cap-specific mRNA (nucleoside-2'-O-)-methyltransferase 2-like n=1 Tax=Physella acuta TaxID=109671 RepID=UPI0027DB5196|nr:cap-specific mRNA (nucleoside-2'-O-)-methyltransferase 2-like [Physella acuta]XP_059151482.1 cap-specific mRNA (nucleoside-2'-O-)-methyltransferase 2-like [Physella acuta]
MQHSASPELTKEEVDEVQSLFKKKFSFSQLPCLQDGSTWLEAWIGDEPSLTENLPEDFELSALKKELNTTKDRLSSQDIETWHSHTTKCNLAALVIPFVKELGVELCTQAWVKFYEILSNFPVCPQESFLSLHLCEAPGAFVTALNHFLQLSAFNHIWDWRATTLHPYYEANSNEEMVADDRLIRHTYTQWYFGSSGRGDITAQGYVKDLYTYMQGVMEDEDLKLLLVTADGSRDCQTNPAEQEVLVSRLHYCELLTACLFLSQHGNFVLKVFTLFEPSSVVMLFLLNVLFTEVHAIKPATSKSGNSEIYLVCLDYRKKVKDSTLWKLLDLLVYRDVPGTLRLIEEIPALFLQEHRHCCMQFSHWQMQTIETNVQLFERPQGLTQLARKQELALKLFQEKVQVGHRRSIKRVAVIQRDMSSFYFAKFSGQHKAFQPIWRHKNLKGTFHLRQNLNSMPWAERVELMEIRDIVHPGLKLQCSNQLEDTEVVEWNDVEKGDAFSVITNSQVCDVTLMTDLNILLSHSDYKKCRETSYKQHCSGTGKMLAGVVWEAVLSDTPQPAGSHPSRGSNQFVFWDDVDEGGAPSLVYESFMRHVTSSVSVRRVTSVPEFVSVVTSSDCRLQVFCGATWFSPAGPSSTFSPSPLEELQLRRKLTQRVLTILRHLNPGSRLILLTTAALTRLTTGLLYILARSFSATSVRSKPNLWLQQLILLDNFAGACPELVKHLTEVNTILAAEAELGATTGCLMEVVNFAYLVNDRRFVQFVTANNNYLVSGFINLMLHHYTQLRAGEGRQLDQKKIRVN